MVNATPFYPSLNGLPQQWRQLGAARLTFFLYVTAISIFYGRSRTQSVPVSFEYRRSAVCVTYRGGNLQHNLLIGNGY